MITDDLVAARNALEAAARDFDPSACAGEDAVRVIEVVGTILKLADGILGKAAKTRRPTGRRTRRLSRAGARL